ncbi:MAG: DUF1573 domain-containing protein [Phycisphaerales bacterium]
MKIPATRKGASGPVRVGPVMLDPKDVDFGIVEPNTVVKTEVKITNMTDKPLRIVRSVPSCQCTTVEMAGTVIAPGATVPMPMSMKTSKSTGIKAAGVTLVFEGYQQPVELSIRSEVAYAVRAVPPFIDVQQAPHDPQNKPLPPQPLKGTFTLESIDGKPFRVTGVHGKPPVFVDFDPARDQPRPKYLVAYDFTSTPPAQVPCYLIVETDRPDCPVMDIRVRHENTRIVPTFKIAEFRSSFGRVEAGAKGEFDLEVKDLDEVRIASVQSRDPAQAEVRLTSQKPDGKNVLCTFELTPAPGRTGMLYFPVTLTTTDGRKTDLLVFGRVG